MPIAKQKTTTASREEIVIARQMHQALVLQHDFLLQAPRFVI